MNDEQIKYALANYELNLSKWDKFQHFGIVGFSFILPITLSLLHLKDYLIGQPQSIKAGEIWFFIIPTVIGLLFYYIQKSRLKFKVINTSLHKKELNKIIDIVAKELEWTINSRNSKIIFATTHPSFFSGSWGEQITILFDNKKVLVNSICDLNKKSSLVSVGRNKQNENELIKAIEDASS